MIGLLYRIIKGLIGLIFGRFGPKGETVHPEGSKEAAEEWLQDEVFRAVLHERNKLNEWRMEEFVGFVEMNEFYKKVKVATWAAELLTTNDDKERTEE